MRLGAVINFQEFPASACEVKQLQYEKCGPAASYSGN